MFSHLILTTVLCGRCRYWLYFRDEDTEDIHLLHAIIYKNVSEVFAQPVSLIRLESSEKAGTQCPALPDI